MSEFTYKLVIEDDGQQVHFEVLDFAALTAILESLPFDVNNYDDEFVSLLDYLARSSSSLVRKMVAGNDVTADVTMELLTKDQDVEIRRVISSLDWFIAHATFELLVDYIQSDVECAKSIAENLGTYTLHGNVDLGQSDLITMTGKIAGMLCNHSDPGVRLALAYTYRDCIDAPKEVLKQLLTDPEHSVRHAARDTLDSLD